MSEELTIGFWGAGKMATALAKGFVGAGLVRPHQLLASDSFAGAREAFAREVGARITAVNSEVPDFASIIFLAVKPAQVRDVLEEAGKKLTGKHRLFSIAAGISLARLAEGLDPSVHLIRVMPNTPALVGASASAFALGHSATEEDAHLAQKLLSTVGVAVQVKESLLDAVTGLSGSGPAYVYMMIEAMSDGGVAAGLPRDLALKLAAQTFLGSARMVLESGLHPGVLKDMVTSPGGTTIEGVHQLESAALRGALISAVRAAAEKSSRLGKS